jgi:flagellar biosynthesis/type III secretory pathway chaperone
MRHKCKKNFSYKKKRKVYQKRKMNKDLIDIINKQISLKEEEKKLIDEEKKRIDEKSKKVDEELSTLIEQKRLICTSICQCCSKISETTKFKRCAQCKEVAYCTVECQKKDWLIHKEFCLKNKKN